MFGITIYLVLDAGITVKLHIVDLMTETIQPPFNLRAHSSNNLEEFKTIVSEVIIKIKRGIKLVHSQRFQSFSCDNVHLACMN